MAIRRGRQWTAVHSLAAVAGLGLAGLLYILKGGPTAGQIAAGSLFTAKGAAVTTTRASNKTCTAADGGLVYLTANQPCVESAGLLVEGASTNLALQSAALATAPWTNGGAATIVNGSATAPDGTAAATSITLSAGTGPASQDVNQGVTTSASTTYTFSVWLWAPAASGAVQVRLARTNTSTWATATVSPTLTLTTTPTRYSLTFTTGAADTASGLVIGSENFTPFTATLNQPFYAWGAQLEQQPFATSYIPTTSTSAARAADVVSVANPLTAAFPFCVGLTWTPESGAAWNANVGGQRIPLSIGTGTGGVANTAKFDLQGTTLYWVDNDGAASFAGLSGTFSPAAGSTHRFIGCKTAQSGYSLTVDGAAFGSAAGTGTGLASQPATIYLGGTSSGGVPAWGYLSDVCVANKTGVCK